jgi:hypothetical protein
MWLIAGLEGQVSAQTGNFSHGLYKEPLNEHKRPLVDIRAENRNDGKTAAKLTFDYSQTTGAIVAMRLITEQ